MSELAARPVFDRPSAPAYQPYEIIRRAFTSRQCERIVAMGNQLDHAEATLEGEDDVGIADGSIRRSQIAWLPPADDTWWIYDKLATIAERANRRHCFDLTGFEEDVQFTTYEGSGSFYSWHQDGLDGKVANRKLSIVVQLSDPAAYEGAELQLFEVAEDYEPDERAAFELLSSEQGAAVVFPSFELHRVLPLRSGTRHSLVAWVTGPPFR